MAKQPSKPETPAKRLANLFRQMINNNTRVDREEQLPRRPLKERLKERPAARARSRRLPGSALRQS